jgi:hypothetical protein
MTSNVTLGKLGDFSDFISSFVKWKYQHLPPSISQATYPKASARMHPVRVMCQEDEESDVLLLRARWAAPTVCLSPMPTKSPKSCYQGAPPGHNSTGCLLHRSPFSTPQCCTHPTLQPALISFHPCVLTTTRALGAGRVIPAGIGTQTHSYLPLSPKDLSSVPCGGQMLRSILSTRYFSFIPLVQ